MPFTATDLQEKINLAINKAKGSGQLTKAQITTILTNIATAQGTDATTHDRTIEVPPAAMMPHMAGQPGRW